MNINMSVKKRELLEDTKEVDMKSDLNIKRNNKVYAKPI